VNEKNGKKSERMQHTLTVEDLAQVLRVVVDGDEHGMESGGEMTYPLGDGRHRPVVRGGCGPFFGT